MKKRTMVIAVLTAVVTIGTTVTAEEKPDTAEKAEVRKQTTCPVMGGEINKKEYVDVKGYRIYVCCPGCKAKIEAEPDKYIQKLKDEGVTPEKIQTVCPVMGGEINKKEYVDVKGYRIYACCPGCKAKIEDEPDQYIKKLNDEGITLEKTPEKAAEQTDTTESHDHSSHQH